VRTSEAGAVSSEVVRQGLGGWLATHGATSERGGVVQGDIAQGDETGDSPT
jgi:hypothetical protein